jgi:hypothetical protein
MPSCDPALLTKTGRCARQRCWRQFVWAHVHLEKKCSESSFRARAARGRTRSTVAFSTPRARSSWRSSLDLPLATGPHELRAVVWRHLWRCVAGLPAVNHDRVFLLINALTQPLDIDDDSPPALDCVVDTDGHYRLRRTEIELCWVAALPHWLGADDLDLTVLNPVRRVTPSTGFFIARSPLSGSQARSFASLVGAALVEASADDELYLCGQAEAARLCEALGQVEGALIDLPVADELEVAGRGTDGRRYPWGNGLEGEPSGHASPWGLDNLLGRHSEWTKTTTETGECTICGGKGELRSAYRTTVPVEDASVRCAVRPVVRPKSR